MKKVKILHKSFSKPISCLTAYSPSIANILDGKIDLILVGDSIGSTLYGMDNTQGVTMDMMKNHGAAVNKTIKKSLKVLDMPYKTYDNKIDAYRNAKILLNHCKPDLLKIEISEKKLVVLKHLVDKKINVISHIGVTPQSYKNFNKIKVLGRTNKEKKNLLKLAKESETLGAKAVLLEISGIENPDQLLKGFSGVKRRFEYLFESEKFVVVNDFARSNTFPSCEAINIPRNNENLSEFLG